MDSNKNIIIREVKAKIDTLAMMDIRYQTFVEQMNIDFKADFDGSDNECVNFILYLDDKAVGTIRFHIEPNNVYRLGRFAVLKEYRKNGLGSILLKYAENYIKENMPVSKIYFHGMAYLKDYYIKMGYEIIGNEFLEENIPHIRFQKTFNN